MRTLSSAPTLASAARADRASAAAPRVVSSASGAGGARPGLDALRAPPDAPIQRVEFSRFSGIRRLWNWSYNDDESRILARERQAREYIDGLQPYAAHIPAVARLHQQLRARETATIGDGAYAGHMADLDRLHDEAERLSYRVSTQPQFMANVEGDAIHAEHGRIHAQINQHGLSSARLNALDALQTRHRDLMTMVHRDNLDLPVPDRAALTPQAHAEVQADWRALTRTRTVVAPEAQSTPGHEADLRSMHGRLLAGANGRILLHGLVGSAGAHGALPIGWTAPDTATPAERRARPGRLREIRRQQAALAVLDAQLTPALMARSAALGPDASHEARQAIAQEHERRLGAPGTRLANAARAATTPPPASAAPDASRLTLREGIRDSESLNDGQAGAGGARPNVVAPAFVIYGHELVHVMRHRRLGPRVQALLPGGWTNQEEQDTIAGPGVGQVGPAHALRALNENALRDDYGLAHRELHTARSRETAGF